MRYYDSLAAVLAVGFMVIGCGDKIPPGNTQTGAGSKIAVQTIVAQPERHPVYYDAVGSVKAEVSATIASKLMGTVTAVNVKEGDKVSQGAPLVMIDARQAAAQLSQANAALAEAEKGRTGAVSALKGAEAGADQARLAHQRGKKMLEGNALTREDFEMIDAQYKKALAGLAQARSMVEAANQRVKQARAAVDTAEIYEKDTQVKAPFDGKITAKQVDVGDLASPGTPLLTVERVGAYRVDLVVPEAYIQTISPGQTLDVRIPSISPQPFEGIVLVVVPAADQVSRTFVVQVSIEPDPRIRSGMFARVTMPIGEKEMIRIPSSALIRQGQLTGLFIVDDASTARFRLVRTGMADNDEVEIISGLNPDTRVVLTPPPTLINSTPVEVVP